ncbi:cyclin-dependent kinase 4 inhibitor B [Eucyclogobius newberryi]|uniref:cyclin-dependent kinase 4 inhibitor B n=1 Tax=Eucyclogobius newberryi TaxID=166745 RepID=UPI003B592E3D
MTLEDDLTAAAATGKTANVEYLLETGARVNGVNRFGRTALQVMMMGSVPVAQLLLKHGADPNVRDPSTGTTPLHDAARTGFVDTVRLLVEFQADPNVTDNNDFRAIDLAKLSGHADVVAVLDNI